MSEIQDAVVRHLSVRLLLGSIVLAVFCLSACGGQTDSGIPEIAGTDPGVLEVADDAYLVPAEFPECRWQGDVDSILAEGYGFPTAHEALLEEKELYYDNFVVIDQTDDTVIWEMSDARGTRAGTVTASKSSSGLWAVHTAVFCIPSRKAAKLDRE
ncbi:MAG: hypothetical protein OXN44_01105 [Acidimicrobiaceae bacterium]|nr:hypothetical protein [Acidimicrobiaceae bacterium]MDE0606308.1 hypothetical protein [Acidimicrobiaceae bacterium]